MAIQGVNQNLPSWNQKSQGKGKSETGSFGSEFMQLIQDRKNEILEKVKKGETEPVIQIGAQAYTEKQWKRMLESFDDSEKDIKDLIREAVEESKKEQAKEA